MKYFIQEQNKRESGGTEASMSILRRSLYICLMYATAAIIAGAQPVDQKIDLKTEYAKTLLELSNTIVGQQITNRTDTNFGAISCIHCNVFHTRAAESVFPLYVSYTITHDKKYLHAAISVANWLIRQQFPD
jgi:hypothetical protein